MIKKALQQIAAYFPAFLLLIAYFIFQYLIPNISNIVTPLQTLRSFFLFSIVLAGLGAVAFRVFKNHIKAGLALWIFAGLFVLSQAFFIISSVLALILITCWVVITRLRKQKVKLHYISFLLSALGVGLVIMVFVLDQTPLNLIFKTFPQIEESVEPKLMMPESPPDIYYIVLDSYARSDVLEDLFAFDNSELTQNLLDRGFIIPTDNHSNYVTSEVSEVATLNMQYVQNLIHGTEGWPYWWLLSPLIEQNTVKTMLEDSGYQSISIEVDYEVINDENVDIHFQPLPIRLNTFEKYLIQTSPLSILSPLIEKLALVNTYSSQRELINFAFVTLSDIPEIEGPKFIYSHIKSPHPPFVFNRNGQPINPDYEYTLYDGKDFPSTADLYKVGYIEQLQYINFRLKDTIDSILEKSKTPPIIIITSDHGSRLYSDFSSSERTCIPEAFSNFMALYLPGTEPEAVPFDLSSVNLFRLIFNLYFGSEFDLLNNEYYFFSEGANLYEFKDVGEYINQDCVVAP